MKVSEAGSGYASHVISACLAEMGNIVTHYSERSHGQTENPAFHEPGLASMTESNGAARRLIQTNSLSEAVDASDIFFIALGHATTTDQQAEALARDIGQIARQDIILVNSSPTSLGFTERLHRTASTESGDIRICTVCHPVFLKEGDAIDDFMRPDRIILGSDDYEARSAMINLLKPFSRQHDRIAAMSVRDAELTRLAASAMLATRISLMNEISAIAEQFGADIENVRQGIGADSRIGYSYLYPGVGYGGLCLTGDLSELTQVAERTDVQPVLLNAVIDRNQLQRDWAFDALKSTLGNLAGKRIAIWGLSFRPDTADVNGSPAIVLIRQLMGAGATIAAYDPLAMDEAAQQLSSLPEANTEALTFSSHQYDALTDADALVLMTEWKPFRQPDFNAIGKILRNKVVIDGRNQYDAEALKQAGFEYRGVGRGSRE